MWSIYSIQVEIFYYRIKRKSEFELVKYIYKILLVLYSTFNS